MLKMRSLAQEVAPSGSALLALRRVQCTSINRQAWETQADLDRLLTLIRYRRIGEPEEIVRAAVWLASDEANCFVGTTLIWVAGMTLDPAVNTNG